MCLLLSILLCRAALLHNSLILLPVFLSLALSAQGLTVALLGREAVAIMQTPAMAERAGAQGFRVDARGPEAFTPFLNAEVERWAKVIAAARITAE